MTVNNTNLQIIEAAIAKGMETIEQKKLVLAAEKKRLQDEYDKAKEPIITRLLTFIGHYFKDYVVVDTVCDSFFSNLFILHGIPKTDDVMVYFEREIGDTAKIRFKTKNIRSDKLDSFAEIHTSLPEALATARLSWVARERAIRNILPGAIMQAEEYRSMDEPIEWSVEAVRKIRMIVRDELAKRLAA